MSDILASKEGGDLNECVRVRHDGSNGAVRSFKGKLILSGENGFVIMREGNWDLACDENGLHLQSIATVHQVMDFKLPTLEFAPVTAGESRVFSRLNASGKTEFCVQFATGGVKVLATED